MQLFISTFLMVIKFDGDNISIHSLENPTANGFSLWMTRLFMQHILTYFCKPKDPELTAELGLLLKAVSTANKYCQQIQTITLAN